MENQPNFKMRKIKKPKIGNWVFVSRWSDKHPDDPWAFGFVESIIIDKKWTCVTITNSSRYWPHFWKIKETE